jgi:hypothetical protein
MDATAGIGSSFDDSRRLWRGLRGSKATPIDVVDFWGTGRRGCPVRIHNARAVENSARTGNEASVIDGLSNDQLAYRELRKRVTYRQMSTARETGKVLVNLGIGHR